MAAYLRTPQISEERAGLRRGSAQAVWGRTLRAVGEPVVDRCRSGVAALGTVATLIAALATVVALGLVSSASAAPLKARFTPVPSRAVTGTISAARGGTLALTAPGGIRIVVKIPRGALLADTTVRVTPITRFRLAPVHGGFVAGVQLAPEGLKLLKPGSVEFRPRKGLRPARRFFLGSQGNGGDVHLVPPAFRRVGRGRNAALRVVSKPIVPILHFSTVEGFDWSKTNLGDLDDIRHPQSAIDRAAHEIAKQLGIERQRQLQGWEVEQNFDDMAKVMERVREHVIKPRLQVVTKALTSRCSLQAVTNAREALVLALGLVREEQLLGLPVSFDTAELMGPILKGTATCMLKQCSRYGPRVIEALIATARQVELIGAPASTAFFNALFDNLVACSKGEVHLDSTINFDDDNTFGDGQFSIHYSMRVVGHAPFEASDGGRWIYHEAPLEYQDVHGSQRQVAAGTTCPGVYAHVDTLRADSNGAFRINQLAFSQLDPAHADTSPPIEKLSLTITQDPTEYQVDSIDCEGADPSGVQKYWVTSFGGLHPILQRLRVRPRHRPGHRAGHLHDAPARCGGFREHTRRGDLQARADGAGPEPVRSTAEACRTTRCHHCARAAPGGGTCRRRWRIPSARHALG